jgi:hypothetical protein
MVHALPVEAEAALFSGHRIVFFIERFLLLRPGRFASTTLPTLAPYHNTGDHVKNASTDALFLRLLGEFDERGTRRRGGQHRGGKIEPGSLAFALQIGAFRIDPGDPPIAARTAEQTPCVIGYRVSMMLVHVLEDLRLRRSESGGIGGKQ